MAQQRTAAGDVAWSVVLGRQPVQRHPGGADRSARGAGFSSFEQQIQDNADVPLVFARMDDPEHNRLRRMMTSDFTA